ncbi:hypothetical protein D3C74_252050 [compost metagenome]
MPVYGSLFQTDVLLAQFLQCTERFEELWGIRERNAGRKQQNIAVIVGVHPNRNLSFIVGKCLKLHFDIRIFLIELGRVIFEYRIHDVCSLGNDGNFSGDISARWLL